MITLTEEQIENSLREVASAQPDFVYERPEDSTSCLYFHGEEPGCIVGQVLAKHGVTAEMMQDTTKKSAYAHNTRWVGDLLKEDVIVTTNRGARMLRAVQASQDSGVPWRTAVGEVGIEV